MTKRPRPKSAKSRSKANSAPRFGSAFQAKLDDLIRWRRDVRRFRPDPIDEAAIDGLIALALLAPSVGNSQPWRFVKVTDPKRRAAVRRNFERANRDALSDYAGRQAKLYASLKLAGLDQAPVHLAVFVEPEPKEGRGLGRRTMPETVGYSAAMAVHTIWLAARARGLGLGWVSILDPKPLAKTLNVPARWRLVAYLCIGYPEEEHAEPELVRAGWQRRVAGKRLVWER